MSDYYDKNGLPLDVQQPMLYMQPQYAAPLQQPM